MAPVTYKSKKDTWLVILMYGIACAALVGCVTLVTSEAPTDLFVIATVLVAGVILPVWILRSTFYVLDDQRLAVRCGPFRWSIPLAKIRSVKRSRSMLSGPALSLDRVQIRHGRFGVFGVVLISPEHRDRFLADLENRRRHLA